MVAPVTNRSIVRLPQRALPALRGIVEISSFSVGKERLGPALTTLFQRLGITPKSIQLDNTAKIRLLGMGPSLEKRTELFESAEVLFSSLRLSAFLTQEQALYILGNKENIDLMAKGTTASAAIASQPQIVLPEMITISNKLAIMRDEVTIGLFKQIMRGYVITGNFADSLRDILNDPSRANDPIVYVSLIDAREFADRLSKLTGRKFRVQTEQEWFQERDKLSGLNFTWTETKNSEGYILCLLYDGVDPGNRQTIKPETRSMDISIRLVEDILSDPPAARPPIMGLYDRCVEENRLNDLVNELRYSDFGTAATKLKYLDPTQAATALSRITLNVDEIFKGMLTHGDLEEMAGIMHQLAVNHPDYALPLFQRLADDSACVVFAVQNLLSKEASELLGVFLKEENGMERIVGLLARCPKEIAELIMPHIELLEIASDLSELKSSW